jgi:hypothetical protein
MMRLVAVTHHEGGGKTLKFEARYDSTDTEHQRFTQATPWGTIEMQIDNPAALEQFEIGKQYYADFSPVG